MGQSTKPFKWVCKNCEYVAHQSPENYGDMSGYPTWNCALRMARLVMEA